ncbi:hypothetical protein A3709_15515 [Halioglobus sp. HI00S01]|uniref:DUF1302 domain-containing protein n=1 Tax=Halioglobus sp. HI00S01 TaxID=1822214 RepID=UPI0007C3EAD3|nr:DUF1302 family protein [Halioglobus sp. HI00S01]KZX58969.1 hypothetical protein A3709_15515 [Halioglobus sp. HI00S01]
MKKKLLALSVLTAISTQAQAFQFDTSDDWEVRWDNTIKGNLMVRTEDQDKQITTPHCAYKGCAWWLADDNTLSVDKGDIVSSRIDILSEFDVIYKMDYGFRISAAGWYDYAYKDSDHPSDRIATWASASVSPGEYTDAADEYHYFGGEILDAFVFGNWDIGETSLGVRAGRHTIYWGNSLLAVGAINGFGGSMSPIDFNKALSVPGSEAKELFLPTAKISGVWQLTDNLTANAFYNFEHERHRLPETGTFFNPAAGLTENTDFVVFPPTIIGEDLTNPLRAGYRVDHKDRTESGDWGVNFQYWIDAWALETSFIYMNVVDRNLHGLAAGADFNRTFPLLAGGVYPDPTPGWDEGARAIGDGYWVFTEDMDVMGVSFAKEIAGISFGLDIVYRPDTAMAPELAAALTRAYNVPEELEGLVQGLGFDVIRNGDTEFLDLYTSDNTVAPLGDTWSVVVNGVGLLGDNGLWEGGSYIFEVTAAMLDDCTENCKLLDQRIKEGRVVTSLAGVFRPTWYQVWPGIDLTIPMSVNYTIDGEKSPFTFGGDEEGGSASLGAELSINQTWTARAAYNWRFGPVLAGIGGLLTDRDNFAVTVKRTF